MALWLDARQKINQSLICCLQQQTNQAYVWDACNISHMWLSITPHSAKYLCR